jgi:hypothetical protein
MRLTPEEEELVAVTPIPDAPSELNLVTPTGFELVFQSRSRYSLGLIAR